MREGMDRKIAKKVKREQGKHAITPRGAKMMERDDRRLGKALVLPERPLVTYILPDSVDNLQRVVYRQNELERDMFIFARSAFPLRKLGKTFYEKVKSLERDHKLSALAIKDLDANEQELRGYLENADGDVFAWTEPALKAIVKKRLQNKIMRRLGGKEFFERRPTDADIENILGDVRGILDNAKSQVVTSIRTGSLKLDDFLYDVNTQLNAYRAGRVLLDRSRKFLKKYDEGTLTEEDAEEEGETTGK